MARKVQSLLQHTLPLTVVAFIATIIDRAGAQAFADLVEESLWRSCLLHVKPSMCQALLGPPPAGDLAEVLERCELTISESVPTVTPGLGVRPWDRVQGGPSL